MAEVVVGIDFGSSGSGFAYSFKDNEEEIIHGSIPGANVDNKVPTEIILNDKNETIKFGVDCTSFMRAKGLKAGHYFKRIKMLLYEKKNSIEAKNTGKILPLKLVIQRVLEQLKELALTQIKEKRPSITLSKIKWVVTVPAIWEEYEKNIMMEACIDAGLVTDDVDKSLFFALEPEAASCYCLKNKSIDQKYLKEGECYIICDLGGGTGDIVAHLIGENYNLNEISPASGGKYGSEEINKLFFEDIVYKIFGCADFNTFYKKYKQNNEEGDDEKYLFNEWSELEREIKDFKEWTNNDKIANNEVYPIKFSIFQDLYKDDTDINILVNKYNNSLNDKDLKLKVSSKRKWMIDFPFKLIYNYIKKQVISICEIINNIIKNSEEEINSIIFVGGYSSNEVLISEIKKQLSNKISQFLHPSKPFLSIMEGAVLFGLNPNKITKRKAKYTIGISIKDFWNEKLHSNNGVKVYDNEYQKWFCEGCFSSFIKVNQDLKLGQEITKSYSMLKPRYAAIVFYKSLKHGPVFVYEEDVEKMGEIKLDAGKEYPLDQRNISVTFRIGGTFIDVKAKHNISGNKIKTKLNFN